MQKGLYFYRLWNLGGYFACRPNMKPNIDRGNDAFPHILKRALPKKTLSKSEGHKIKMIVDIVNVCAKPQIIFPILLVIGNSSGIYTVWGDEGLS